MKAVSPHPPPYDPAGQGVQDCAPVPAGHNEQVAADADEAPDCPYFPAEQSVPEQVDGDVAPTPSEYVPAGQDWQY